MNYKKYNTVGTVSKSNRKLIEIKEKSAPLTHIQYLAILKFPKWRMIFSSLYQEPKHKYKYHYKNNSKLTFDF